MRAVPLRAVLLRPAGLLLAALLGNSCIGSGEPNCGQYLECGTCVMEEACGFCFETNACIPDGQTCPGDRAQTPDMCADAE